MGGSQVKEMCIYTQHRMIKIPCLYCRRSHAFMECNVKVVEEDEVGGIVETKTCALSVFHLLCFPNLIKVRSFSELQFFSVNI